MSRSTLTTIRRSVAPVAASCTLAAAAISLAGVPHAAAGVATFPASTSARVTQGSVAVEIVNQDGSGRPAVLAISARGVKTTVANLTAGESLLDVSPDGRRLVTTSWMGTPTLRVYDLAKHTVTPINRNVTTARFTNPTGAGLLISNSTNGAIMRIDLTGKTQASFATTYGASFVPSVDGLYLYGMNKSGAITLNGNATGKLIRTYAKPKGFTYCTPTRNWSSNSVVASCINPTTNTSQAFVYRSTGGAAIPITSSLKQQPFGYTDAWNSSAGPVVQIGSSCGPAPSLLVRNSKLTTLPITALVDVFDATAYGLNNLDCGDSKATLVRADLPSMTSHTLLNMAQYKGQIIAKVRVNDPTQGSI